MKSNQQNMLVTIVTPSFNQGQFIEETITSLLTQTYNNIQYIIVDGGSTDNTMDIIAKYRDRIDIVIHEPDQGQSDAINKGFRLAAGELVGWLNSDDILYEDCVEQIVKLANRFPNGSIYYPSIIDFIDSSGSVFRKKHIKIQSKQQLLNRNYDVIQQGSFYKTSLVRKSNYLNPGVHYCMDLDLWLKLLSIGNIYSFDDKALSAFRIWDGTKTVNGEFKFLNDIEDTLNAHGMKFFSKNNLKLQWCKFKEHVRNVTNQEL